MDKSKSFIGLDRKSFCEVQLQDQMFSITLHSDKITWYIQHYFGNKNLKFKLPNFRMKIKNI